MDHPLSQQQQQHQQQTDSPKKGQTYHTLPNRKMTESPAHQLIQIQQSNNIDNGMLPLPAPINANNLYYPIVNRFPYHYQATAQAPQAFFLQNDNNCEYYLTSSAQPLYVPASNLCRSATGSPQHQSQQQPAFHLVHLSTNPNQANLTNKNQCNTNQQAMHIKQIHTATVHGKCSYLRFFFVFFSFCWFFLAVYSSCTFY